MNDNEIQLAKAHRKAYWAGARKGFAQGFSESVTLAVNAALVTTVVVGMVLVFNNLSGGRLVPSMGPTN